MLAGGRGADSVDCADCTARCVHGIELPPDGGGQRCSAERGVPRAVPPSAWNWSTKQPEGQASEEFNGQAGFLRLGLFGTAALAAGTGCGEEALPRALRGTPAFVRSAAPG